MKLGATLFHTDCKIFEVVESDLDASLIPISAFMLCVLARPIWWRRCISFQDAGNRSEFSQHIRHHHVLDLELGRGVNAIDGPGTGAHFGLNRDKPRLFEFRRFANALALILFSCSNVIRYNDYMFLCASAVPNSRARFVTAASPL
jgi:hypothetical protein